MTTLRLTGFAGETPKTIPRLIADMAAQLASNVRLDDGGLTPIRLSTAVASVTPPGSGTYQTIYNWLGTWLAWTNVVHAAPGPVAQDRLYIMGDGAPRLRVGSTEYPLKLAPPAGALTGTPAGTPTAGSLSSTRLYVYTWVTAFGEESAPSPASNEITWQPGQTVTLSGFAATPAGRNITKQRIYRSQTSTTGTQLYFIAERAATNANFSDTVAENGFVEPLPSLNYDVPLDTLDGLVAGPAGMMAAFSGKDVYFCEPWQPHAWPVKYSLTTDYAIVGLAWFGSSLAILTTGKPYIATGSTPDSMVMERVEQNQPCINPRGIVDLGTQIAYPSPDGLVVIGNGGAGVVTTSLFSKDDWQRLNPQNFVAAQYNGRYLFAYDFYDVRGQHFVGTMAIDLTGSQPFLIRYDIHALAMFFDETQGALFYLQGNTVMQWDGLYEQNAVMAWRSKLISVPTPTNFGAILIEADASITAAEAQALAAARQAALDANAATFAAGNLGGVLGGQVLNQYDIDGDVLLPVPSLNQSVTVNVYADQELVATVGELVNEVDRLPGGFKARLWEVEVVGTMPISQISLAGMARELQGVS